MKQDIIWNLERELLYVLIKEQYRKYQNTIDGEGIKGGLDYYPVSNNNLNCGEMQHNGLLLVSLARGAYGGDCWGGEAESFNSPYWQSLQINDFNIILEIQKKYKTITSLNFNSFLYEDFEYYGNFKEYECFYITFEDLFEGLGI